MKKIDEYLHRSMTLCFKSLCVFSYETVKNFHVSKFSFYVHAVVIGSHASEKLLFKNFKERKVIYLYTLNAQQTIDLN